MKPLKFTTVVGTVQEIFDDPVGIRLLLMKHWYKRGDRKKEIFFLVKRRWKIIDCHLFRNNLKGGTIWLESDLARRTIVDWTLERDWKRRVRGWYGWLRWVPEDTTHRYWGFVSNYVTIYTTRDRVLWNRLMIETGQPVRKEGRERVNFFTLFLVF